MAVDGMANIDGLGRKETSVNTEYTMPAIVCIYEEELLSLATSSCKCGVYAPCSSLESVTSCSLNVPKL